MKIYINEQELQDFKIEDEKTIGDILKAIEIEAEKNNATIIKIFVDGNEIPADKIEEINSKEYNDSTIIATHLISALDITAALKDLSKPLDEISKNLLEIPVLIQTGKNKEADTIISNFANFIDSFCQISSLTGLFRDYFESFKINDLTINDFFQEFSPIMKDFADAYEEKDLVTVSDLAEYELSPRIQEIGNAINKLQ